jgi:hypothetical protein
LQIGIDSTDSPDPCARVGNLSAGHAYLFMVAGINAAGMGEFSAASPPLHQASDANGATMRSLNASLSSPTSSVLSSPRSLYSGDSPPHGNADVPALPPFMMAPDLGIKGQQPGLALAPAPSSDVVDAFMETMAAEAMSIGDDDLVATLQNLLDNTFESPRVEAIRRRRQDSMDEMSTSAAAKRCRVDAAVPPPTKRSSFSFDLEAADLELLLGDALPDVHSGPLYRNAQALPGMLKRASAEGFSALKGASNASAKERLKGALSRSVAEGSDAKLLSPGTIYKLKARGFSRTATRLLTLAARADPAGAPKLLSAANLPDDDTARSLMHEASLLASSAPAPSAAVPAPPKLIVLSAPRTKRASSFLAVCAVAAALASIAAGGPAALAAAAAGLMPASLLVPPVPSVECGFRLLRCVQTNDVPGGSCQLAFSPLPTCRPA